MTFIEIKKTQENKLLFNKESKIFRLDAALYLLH